MEWLCSQAFTPPTPPVSVPGAWLCSAFVRWNRTLLPGMRLKLPECFGFSFPTGLPYPHSHPHSQPHSQAFPKLIPRPSLSSFPHLSQHFKTWLPYCKWWNVRESPGKEARPSWLPQSCHNFSPPLQITVVMWTGTHLATYSLHTSWER